VDFKRLRSIDELEIFSRKSGIGDGIIINSAIIFLIIPMYAI
jgi:hypothetical protein